MLYLIAGNGSPNYGDELIVQNWMRFYRDNGYDGPITVDGKGASASEKLLRGFGDARFVKTDIPRHADGHALPYSGFYDLGRSFAHEAATRFKDVVAFHMLGGGYASANWYNAARLIGAVAELGRILGVPTVATGLGVAPFNSMDDADRAVWREMISGFALFECRDQESFDGLSDLSPGAGVLSLGLDDAFLYGVSVNPHSGCWLHLSGFSDISVFGKYGSKALGELMPRFDKTIFWICSKADGALYSELLEQYPNLQRYSNERLLNQGLPISPGDFMLTGRFHPHLQAARTGNVAGYFNAGSGFYRTKHNLVSALGSPFRRLNGCPELFAVQDGGMAASDSARVVEKRRVAHRVLKELGLAR